jgi:hypothetical protein
MAFVRRQDIALQSASILLLPPILHHLQGVSRIRLQCEAESEEQGRGQPPSKKQSNTNSSLSHSNNNDQQQQHNKREDESCAGCLYTGVATCTGLALYFAKIALLEVPDISRDMPREVASAHRRSRAGFLAVSATWLGISVYRWHLG